MSSGEEMMRFLQMLPVGFGFHPTDEQLVNHYLFSKIQGKNSHLKMEILGNDSQMDIIQEVDVCQYEPWELAAQLKHPGVFEVCDSTNDPEWYFFSTPQKKYQNGRRLKRATEKGFWKPTGPDRKIMCRATGKEIGTKKTLVFHRGRGPSAARTPWLIHEFHSSIPSLSRKENNTFLCRLRRDVGPGFPIETNLNSMSPDIPSNQASSSITMEVGCSSTGAGIPDRTGDLANTATVGSTNFASDTKDDKQDHITSDFRNNWEEDHIIPLKTDVLSGLREDTGSEFPQETNLNCMSLDLPSIQEPVLTTMEVDNSSAGAGIHQTSGGSTDNMNLDASDMIYQHNINIDNWDAINYHVDDMISQKTDVLSGLKEDAGSDFPQETNLNRSMSLDLPSIQAPSLTTMEVDNSSAGAGIHQIDGPADNSDMIYQQNHIDWNTINYYEDDTISQDFERLAETLEFDLGYGYVYDIFMM